MLPARTFLRDGSRLVDQHLPIPQRSAWSTCFLSELLVEILDDLPELRPQLVETGWSRLSGLFLW